MLNCTRFFRDFRRRLIVLSITVLAACGGSGGGAGESNPIAEPPAAFVATSVQSALNYGVDNGLDGAWAFVDDSSGATEFVSAGVRDRASSSPAELTDLFKIASISKMFIAVCGTKMVDAGFLALDDTLAEWLPDLAARIENADTITVRHLLLHRSGVPDFDSQPGFSWNDSHSDIDAVLDLALDRPADFSPDARYEYSNTNYLLLGRIFDTALGYHHHQFIQNNVLSPLGMANTYLLLEEANVGLMAHGYWNGVDRITQDYVVPGGSMISTAQEVGVFLRALATGDLLSPSEHQIYDSLFAFRHSGWLPGYQSDARYLSGEDTVLVLFVNETGGSSERVTREVFDSLVDYLGRR